MSNTKNPDLIFTEEKIEASKYGNTANISDRFVATIYTPDEKCTSVAFDYKDFGDTWVTNMGSNKLTTAFISVPYTQWTKTKTSEGDIVTNEILIDPYYNQQHVIYGFLNAKALAGENGGLKPNPNPETGEPDPEHYGYTFQPRYSPVTDKVMAVDEPYIDIPPNLYKYHEPWPYAPLQEE